MKVSVIMASYLGDYPGNICKNKDKKFVRAVNSFLKQSYTGEKELIIVGDGCQKTKDIYEANWKDNKEIKYFGSPKQPTYAGGIRDIGIKIATGEIICYLDNDDVLGKTHIETIVEQFTDDVDWVYYNDYLVLNKEFTKFEKRWVDPRWGKIGTSSIAHRNPKFCDKFSDLLWFNGYSHDWLFVMKLASSGGSFKKLKIEPQYIVCHTGNSNF